MSQTKAQLIDTLVASLLPASDSAVDIGSNAVRFANIYGDTLYGNGANLTGINTDLVSDTSPQLGGNLDVNTKNILFGDSASASDDRLIFGAGSDLSIYHNGTHSFIQDSGTGNLMLATSAFQVTNADNDHDTLAAICLIDSPSTTNATTYTVYTQINNGDNFYTFESGFGGVIVLEEIAQ